MSLQKQHIPLVLAGMDTKTDDKNTASGALVLAKNMVMNKTKKWQNRRGYVEHASAYTAVANCIAEDNGTITTLSPAAINQIGTASGSALSTSPMFTHNAYYSINNADSVQFISPTLFVSRKATSPFISFYFYNAGTLSWQYTLSSTAVWDSSASATEAFFVNSAESNAIYKCNASGHTKYTTTVAGTVSAVRVATLTSGGKTYCLVYYVRTDNTSIYGYIYNSTDNTFVAPFLIHSTYYNSANISTLIHASECSDGNFHVCVPSGASTFSKYKVTTAGVVTSDGTQTINAAFYTMAVSGITSAFMSYSGTVYYVGTLSTLSAHYTSDYNGTLLPQRQITSVVRSSADVVTLTKWNQNSPYGTLAYSSTEVWKAGKLILGHGFGYIDGGSLYYSDTDLLYYSRSNASGVVHLSTAALPCTASYNGQTFSNAGGVPSLFDAGKWQYCTAGFYSPPMEIKSHTTGAGVLPAGTYKFFFAWKFFDGQGQVYYSPASSSYSVTTAGTGSITLTYNEYMSATPPSEPHGSIAGEPADLVICATEAGGTLYYQQLVYYGSNLPYGGLANTCTIGAASQIKLTEISTPLWPFQSGVVESGALPVIGALSRCMDRLWAPLGFSEDTWVFSTKPYPTFGPRFPEEYRFRTQASAGAPKYACELDNKILLMHEFSIFATWGDGPDETNAGQFAPAILVTSSVGCKYPRSVVITDGGVMFMSHEGIWRVNKNLSLEYVGKDVEAYNSLTITGAFNLTDRHQIWFYSAEGTTLCYDDFHGIWSVFDGQATTAPVIIKGVPHFVRTADSKLLIESAAAYNDAGTTFNCELKSGWISLAGVQGFERMYRFTVTGAAANTATLTLYRDWSASSFETFTVGSAVSSQWQVRPKIQKGEGMQFDLLWSNITGAVEVSAFAIEAGLKQGTYKVAPATNRVKGN